MSVLFQVVKDFKNYMNALIPSFLRVNFFFFFAFLGLLLQHMKVSRLGVELEL